MKPRKVATDAEADKIIKAMAAIEDEDLSDLEDPKFREMEEHYKRTSLKRAADIEEAESVKRKVSTSKISLSPFSS